ncbi:MAG: Holliday junction branch migration protein RuvA [Candidatus Doudnabacteria bacterium]|nr:Holliday junction branch migration protein RuvA [Candidatus Doudnabacteria bacterium]
MIGHINGKVLNILADKTIIVGTASGVGYRLNVGNQGFLVDQAVALYVYTAVRENEISLWGFENIDNQKLFELLLGVNGIGLKTAFTLVNEVGGEAIAAAIASGDPKLIKVPGVGPKIAERLILELKGKVDHISPTGAAQSSAMSEAGGRSELEQEAVSALVALGYKDQEVVAAIRKLKPDEFSTTESLVKALLTRI